MKKTLITVLILVVLALAGYLVYGYFFSGTSSNDSTGVDEQDGRAFNPFGFFSKDADVSGDVDQKDGDTTDPDSVNTVVGQKRLIKLSSVPVAGVVSGLKDGKEVFRYVDRATAHVSDFYPESKSVVRIANTTIPRIQEVVWGGLDTLALRYLDDDKTSVVTFVASILPAVSTSTEDIGELSGTFFPTNVTQIAFDSTGSELLYLREDGGVFGTKTSIQNSATSNVFSSPISEWLLEWGRQQTATLTTKPSTSVSGQLFFLNTASGAQTHVLRDIPALTTKTDVSATRVAYSGSNDQFTLHIYNTDAKTTLNTVVATLPEKCVWGTGVLYCAVPQTLFSNLPDAWYQGRVSFNDSLWEINVQTGFATFLFDPQQFDEVGLDMAQLTLSPSESHLAFVNKKDGSLWVYDLLFTQADAEASAVDTLPEEGVSE